MFAFVQLIGRVGQTPEIKRFQSGDKASFSVAVNERYKQNGEPVERTHWFNCEAWGHTASYVQQYVNKGDKIAIAGRLQQQSWETPTGEKKTRVVIRVETITSLGNTRNGGLDDEQVTPLPQRVNQNSQPKVAVTAGLDIPEEEVPF